MCLAPASVFKALCAFSTVYLRANCECQNKKKLAKFVVFFIQTQLECSKVNHLKWQSKELSITTLLFLNISYELHMRLKMEVRRVKIEKEVENFNRGV